MKKLQALRQHLLDALPAERHYTDQLHVRVDNGTLYCTAGNDLNHQQRYTVQLSFDEYQDTLDELTVPLLEWLRCYEPSALTPNTLVFDAELLPNGHWRIALSVPLSERIKVHKDCAHQRYHTEHLLPTYADDFCQSRQWSLVMNDERAHNEWPLQTP